MTDIEKKAREYANDAFIRAFSDREMPWNAVKDIFEQTFLAGASYALGNQWRDIPTDKDGFGDADAIDSIILPIVVRYQDGHVFTVNNDWSEELEWYQDILNHPARFNWLPIPYYEPKEEQ